MTTPQQDLVHEYRRVIKCAVCQQAGERALLRDDVFDLPQPGYVGNNYAHTRVLLVGRNPGVSRDRFAIQDGRYAELLVAVRDGTSGQAMEELQALLEEIIPTWPVHGRHFPLSECGLALADIAFLNLVRCRTRNDKPPSTGMVRNCLRHFVRWLDMLKPRVVVCVSKWAHDQVVAQLDSRGIPHTYVNRDRSLRADERRSNREAVAAFVHQHLGCEAGAGHGVRDTVAEPTPASRGAHTSQADAACASVRPLERRGMNSEAYDQLFRELGFVQIELRKTLKHPRRPVPSLYYNRGRDAVVFFTGYARDRSLYPGELWDFIEPRQKKDRRPDLITVVPKQGKESEAFRNLVG